MSGLGIIHEFDWIEAFWPVICVDVHLFVRTQSFTEANAYGVGGSFLGLKCADRG